MQYQCCFCKNGIEEGVKVNNLLDPCALIIVANIDQSRPNQKEQKLYCHFDCFRKVLNDDNLLYIRDPEFSTIGDITSEDCEDESDEDDSQL